MHASRHTSCSAALVRAMGGNLPGTELPCPSEQFVHAYGACAAVAARVGAARSPSGPPADCRSVRALTYRLERIHKLTGANPADPRHRYMLRTAVIGDRLLDWPAKDL